MADPTPNPEQNPEQPDRKQSGALRDYAKAEQMIQLAIAIPAGCLIGWFLGSLGDRAWHQQWIGIAGVILGAIGGFMQMYRLAAKSMKDNS